MRRIASLLASLSLLLATSLPASATLVAEDTKPPVDNAKCFALLWTNPAQHAAECGGPFEVDNGTQTLVTPVECQVYASADFSLFAGLWRAGNYGRIEMADTSCCHTTMLFPQFEGPLPVFELTMGQRIQIAGC